MEADGPQHLVPEAETLKVRGTGTGGAHLLWLHPGCGCVASRAACAHEVPFPLPSPIQMASLDQLPVWEAGAALPSLPAQENNSRGN